MLKTLVLSGLELGRDWVASDHFSFRIEARSTGVLGPWVASREGAKMPKAYVLNVLSIWAPLGGEPPLSDQTFKSMPALPLCGVGRLGQPVPCNLKHNVSFFSLPLAARCWMTCPARAT